MNEEQSAPAKFSEMVAIHAICAMLVMFFMKYQASNDTYYQAGEESLIANGVSAVFDILYWMFKPRILRWRNQK